MKKAPIGPDEEERLQALLQYEILDTLGEKVFDDITELAASICQTPIALVSLIDSDRQWFKSKVGVDIAELSRDTSFCGHAIHSEDIFEIRNADEDPRFHDNPLVTSKVQIKFYAGAPLIAPNGLAIGSLCVANSKPQSLNDSQKKALKTLANHVMVLLELRTQKKIASDHNDHLDEVLGNMTEGLVIFGAEGMILEHNQAALQILEVSEGQLFGKRAADQKWARFHSDGRPLALHEHPALVAFETGRVQQNFVMGLKARHKIKWISVSAVPIKKQLSAEVDHVICTFQDITSVREKEMLHWETSELQRKILAGASHAIISSDLLGNILTYNQSAEKLIGYSAEDIIGKQKWTLFHDPEEIRAKAEAYGDTFQCSFRNPHEVLLLKPLQGMVEEGEWSFIRKDGSRIAVKLNVTGLRSKDNELMGYLGIISDITEEKRIRDELIQANEQALQASLAKSQFLANMSHEIRTPMNGVLGLTNLLLADSPTPLQKERLKLIQSCGDSLLGLISDVLDFSKLEAKKIELEHETFNIHDLVSEAVHLLSPKAGEKSLLLNYRPEIKSGGWVKGDSSRVKQVLINLLSNAIKFTEQGGVKIESNCEFVGNSQYKYCLSVKDSGIGVPSVLAHRLFQSFSQIDASTTRKYGGSGLGLAISQGLAEQMGGKIWLEKSDDIGATFHFEWIVELSEKPINVQASQPSIQIDRNLSKRFPLQILIAEDNFVNQQVLAGFLESLGYASECAYHGREVLRKLEHKKFDLIFMDCHMPEMDGFETTREILRLYPQDRPRIVAVTADIMPEDVARCLKSGMDGFVAKPVTVSSLVKALVNSPLAQVEIESAEGTGPDDEIMDQKSFLKNFSGLEEIAEKTVASFMQLLPQFIKDIEVAADSRNAAHLELAAHTLKGAASNFHAKKLVAVAYSLERAAKTGDFYVVTGLMKQLESERVKLLHVLMSLRTIQRSA